MYTEIFVAKAFFFSKTLSLLQSGRKQQNLVVDLALLYILTGDDILVFRGYWLITSLAFSLLLQYSNNPCISNYLFI